MAFWPFDRMFTTKFEASAKVSQECAVLARQTKRSGGSSDTEVKLLAVKPRGVPSGWTVVMTVPPVAKVPKAVRRARGFDQSPTGPQTRWGLWLRHNRAAKAQGVGHYAPGSLADSAWGIVAIMPRAATWGSAKMAATSFTGPKGMRPPSCCANSARLCRLVQSATSAFT